MLMLWQFNAKKYCSGSFTEIIHYYDNSMYSLTNISQFHETMYARARLLQQVRSNHLTAKPRKRRSISNDNSNNNISSKQKKTNTSFTDLYQQHNI